MTDGDQTVSSKRSATQAALDSDAPPAAVEAIHRFHNYTNHGIETIFARRSTILPLILQGQSALENVIRNKLNSVARKHPKPAPPSADAPNSPTNVFSSYASTPQLSIQAGWQSGPINVNITAAPGDQIYYTLDGSEPTNASTLYTA